MAVYVENAAGLAALRGHIHGAIERLGEEVATDARGNAPVDTGLLKSSVSADAFVPGSGFGGRIRIYARTPYAAMVELGTRPHIIRALNARVLANARTGQVFGPLVHHPGTKANPFLRAALFQRRSLR